MYIWQYILIIYIYIYIIPGMMVYVSTFSILWGVLNPITTWQSLGIIQCPLRIGTCRRSLESCLGRGCAWHRARFLRGTKRSGISKFKGMSLWLLLTKSKTETEFNSDSKDQKIYCIETELGNTKMSTCMTLLNSRCITCPPSFGPKIFQGAILLWRSREEPPLGGIEGGRIFDEFGSVKLTPEKRPPFLAKDGNSARGIPNV